AIWWDDVGEEIRLQVLRAISTTAETFDDSNIVEGSLKVREQPGKRISQVWCYFGILNPLKGVSDPDNFRSTAIRVDLDAEEDYGQPAIKKIFSRWIPFGGLTIADRVTAILLGRFGTAPRHLAYELFRRGEETPTLGEGCRIFGLPMQDATGALANVPIQITRLNPDVGVYQVEAEEQLFVDLDNEDPNVHPIIIDSNTLNVDLRVLHDTLFGTLDDGVVVNVTVNAGVIVGSTSTSVAAMIVGTWPTKAVTGNRTSGSPTLTGIANTTGLAIGQRVFGTGIPAGAKILSIVTNTSITLDMNASSGSSTSTSLTIHTVIINLALRGRVQGKGGNGGQGGTAFDTTNGDGRPGQAGGLALYSRYGVNIDLTSGGQIFGGGGGGGGASVWFYSLGDGGGGGAGSVPGSGGAIGGSTIGEQPGAPGTTEAGGAGGHNTGYGGSDPHGGNGGGPGIAGASGTTFGGGYDGGAGGAAGGAIDGVSYLVKTGTGDIRGTEIN
ncbi:MAG: acanthoscurrin, partial [Devosia sp.]|nr:acanthoscurrin [Devosia sp.]